MKCVRSPPLLLVIVFVCDQFVYDVFDSEGKFIAKTQLPVLPKYWKNGKMFTIEEDESGFQYVKRYNVTWNY